ncbi:MAG: hypothetical protein ACE15D_06475 [Candidatus Eisenbacteria bacterium]|nr:hypothetical protein [Candidatus Eisenbacteria bacterium]
MTIEQLKRLLACEWIAGPEADGDEEIVTCYAADLMSDVLAFSTPRALLLTGLTSIQSVHTADIADMAAVVFISGKRPDSAVVSLADQKGIPILTTGLTMFEACGLLHRAGLEPASKKHES